MAIHPHDLIRGAIAQAVDEGTLAGDCDTQELLIELTRDPVLLKHVEDQSSKLVHLGVESYRIAGFVRDAVDPYNLNNFRKQKRPNPFDLISQAINPALRTLLYPFGFIVSIADWWPRRRRLTYYVLLVAVATLSVFGSAYLIFFRRWWTYGVGIILVVGAVLASYLLGFCVRLIQSVRYGNRIRAYAQAPKHWIDVDYQRHIDAIVNSDPDYVEALEALASERTRVVLELARSYIPSAAERVASKVAAENARHAAQEASQEASKETPDHETARLESTLPSRNDNSQASVRAPSGATSAETGTDQDHAADANTKGDNPKMATPSPLAPAAFISYVTEDLRRVNRLQKELVAAGVDVWRDRDRLQPGERWKDAIRRSIVNGGFFIACFSEESEAKERSYMREELAVALEEMRKRPRDRAWFIPVMLTKTEIPDQPIGAGETLRDIQYLDLHKKWRDGVDRLVVVLLGHTP